MKWIDGLVEFNKTKKYQNWDVPRKGTHSYKAVMEMIKPVTIKPMMITKIMAQNISYHWKNKLLLYSTVCQINLTPYIL